MNPPEYRLEVDYWPNFNMNYRPIDTADAGKMTALMNYMSNCVNAGGVILRNGNMIARYVGDKLKYQLLMDTMRRAETEPVREWARDWARPAAAKLNAFLQAYEAKAPLDPFCVPSADLFPVLDLALADFPDAPAILRMSDEEVIEEYMDRPGFREVPHVVKWIRFFDDDELAIREGRMERPAGNTDSQRTPEFKKKMMDHLGIPAEMEPEIGF